jgi:hypothetical protein
MPRERESSEEQVVKYERILLPIEGPITDEEARVLASLFPPDGTLFGSPGSYSISSRPRRTGLSPMS